MSTDTFTQGTNEASTTRATTSKGFDTMKTETNAQSTPTLIDTIETLADYDMMAMRAIINHPTHGRILITQGFCGIDEPRGGAIRWSGGDCVSLKDDDTFSALYAAWNDATTIMDAVLHGHDDARPHLDWDGRCIEAVAESVGL